MENTKNNLKSLESKWFESFYSGCKACFGGISLPSHNHRHHHRVWQFVKLILGHLEAKGIDFSSQELLNLMLASFFHDTGMSLTFDESHGKAGADICRRFIESSDLNINEFLPALEAIEKHDDKQYLQLKTLNNKPSIVLILSTADDLDAFGFTGILRYAEIYLLRDKKPEEIPDKVINNADRRFLHFKETFRCFEALVEKQKPRYEQLINFYKSVRRSSSNQSKRKILEHVYQNIENHQNNQHLTDLLTPVNSQYIKNFREKVIQEHRGILDMRPGHFS
jgi:hypothetical protein